ncbi:MAG: LPS export ABC transporter periplasmic protein LptC [Cryomorphaceae bacterium]|nr:LPS export ABC transporter periplasmic protein LptC [Cryomorphaceae bacterium]
MRLFLFFLVVLVSCTNDPKLVQEFVSDKQQPIEQIKGAELLHTENGKVKVRVVASRIERFQDIEPSLIFSDHLEVYFYNDSSQLQSTLMADYASIDEGKKIMLAQNNVILISSDDKKLETDELIWDENKNKIFTDKKVKITTGKEVIYGEGFTSTPDFKQYSITKINGTFDFATQTH